MIWLCVYGVGSGVRKSAKDMKVKGVLKTQTQTIAWEEADFYISGEDTATESEIFDLLNTSGSSDDEDGNNMLLPLVYPDSPKPATELMPIVCLEPYSTMESLSEKVLQMGETPSTIEDLCNLFNEKVEK